MKVLLDMELSNRYKEHLEQIVELSHRFGTTDYVRGGGGNTSVKNETVLWVKPSGTTLSSLKAESFLAMDRKILSKISEIEPPANPAAREVLVKEKMADAVLSQTTARASVEAPLHNTLNARFVVHTHPAIVNGMTCSRQGPAACKELFPEALWLDYIDPGYTLCMKVRHQILKYKAEKGREPEIIFLKNHGVFVAADEPERICSIYEEIMSKLREHYAKANVSTTLTIKSCLSGDKLEAAKTKSFDATGNDELGIEACGAFDIAEGPVSPDHIVYSKSYALIEEPTQKTVEAFKKKHGYLPQVMAFDNGVFGGIEYMTDRARKFIENWGVEAYRTQQI